MPSAQDDFQGLQNLAERLGLEDSDKENFISSSMTRLGHKMRTMWEDGGGDDSDSGGDFFSKGKPKTGGGKDKGAGWQYQ